MRITCNNQSTLREANDNHSTHKKDCVTRFFVKRKGNCHNLLVSVARKQTGTICLDAVGRIKVLHFLMQNAHSDVAEHEAGNPPSRIVHANKIQLVGGTTYSKSTDSI